MEIKTEKQLAKDITVNMITVRNQKGFEVCFTDFGAAIYYIAYPDRKGRVEKVTMAVKDLYNFITSGAGYGKSIGRVAGRIKDAKAIIDGKEYNFDKNEGKNCLHGGKEGLSYKRYDYEIKSSSKKTDVIFTIKSPDGEGGFPGNVVVKITYTIPENKKEVTIKFQAKTDKATLINLTNHLYLNLNGAKAPIFDHELYLRASKVAQFDDGLIIQGFEDVPQHLDYTKPTKLGENINKPILMNHRSHGMDHVFLFDGINKKVPSAELYLKDNKRKMTMYTDYPAIIVYCDNFPSHEINTSDVIDEQNYGLTFETILPTDVESNYTFTPEKPYKFTTKYKFN